jgi:hypothetical protein
MTQKTNLNPWLYDTRVRERHIRAGSIDEKDVEKFLAQLPDLADQAEPFGLPQPALAQPEPEDLDDEDEDEDEVEPEATAAAPEPEAPSAPADGTSET